MKISVIHILSTVAFGAMITMLSSCGSDNNDNNYSSASMSDCYNYVYRSDAPMEGVTTSGATYVVQFNNSDKTAAFGFTGLRMGASSSVEAATFANIQWSYDDRTGERLINAPTLTSTDGRTTIQNLKLRYIRMVSAQSMLFYDGMWITFDMDGQGVTVIPESIWYVADTEVTSPMGLPYTTSETSYIVNLKPDEGKADLTINNPKFAAEMPTLSQMEFGGMSLQMTPTGYVIVSDSLIPSISGTPYPSFAVSDLSLSGTMDASGTLQFNCMGTFTAHADLKFGVLSY